MKPRLSLLSLTAAAAAMGVVANAVPIAAAVSSDTGKSRLGGAIEQDMSERDAAQARRSRGLDLREQAARATEARLQAELDQRGPSAAGVPAPDAQYDDLARIYQAMKPARAAVVFEQLELEVQMKVAQRMRDRSTALIMAAMSPRAAAALTMALARRYASPAQTAATTVGGGRKAAR
ncbi:MAG: hypothetical protein QM688_05105 [Sphingomonas bacterium]